MDEELRGYKQGQLDLLDSYNQFYLQKKRLTRDAKPMTCSGVRPSKLSAGINTQRSVEEWNDLFPTIISLLFNCVKIRFNGTNVGCDNIIVGNEYKAPMDPIYYHQKQCAFGPANTRCPLFR